MFAILVIEDDPSTRRLMSTVLRRGGYTPIDATDGEDALRIMDRQHVDLILLDIMMPRMDGFEFTKTVREGGCNVPILMTTAKETLLSTSPLKTLRFPILAKRKTLKIFPSP